MSLRYFISEGAWLRLKELERQMRECQIEAAEIMTRETAGKQLGPAEQFQVEAVQATANILRAEQSALAGAAGEQLAQGMAGIVLNHAAEHLQPQTEEPEETWPEDL